MKILIGLQNNGTEYEYTRHNAGVILLNEIVTKNGGSWHDYSGKKRAEANIVLQGKEVLCIKPLTFMNISAEGLKEVPQLVDVKKDIIVLHDDIDLPLGSLKISYGKNSGGNNGVESLIGFFGTNEFLRIRIGVSPVSFFGTLKKPKKEKTGDFVLGKFKSRELDKIISLRGEVEKIVEIIDKEGYLKAMSLFN